MIRFSHKMMLRKYGASPFRCLALATAALLLPTGLAHAQLTTADIVGTVTDPSGAVVPGATVVVRNLGTNAERTVTSDGSGNYTVSLLPVGHYSITVTAAGFKKQTTPDLSVEAGDRASANEQLQLGASSETVNVEATTPLLQADNATVSSTVTAQAVQDLPLNGRNFVQLVQLVPGANEGPGNGLTSGGRPDDRRVSASFSVNGQDDTLNNYVIDGVDDNERVIGTIGIRPNVEAIQEITVQTNSYAAEAGRTAGGVVNIVTRSGTNKFHGTAYEFFRNNIFDARNALQPSGQAKPELRQNQFGGSIGGPIIKNRTFFFGAYEGFRQVSGITYKSTVPTLYQYDAIHSLNNETPQTLISQGNGTQGLAVDPVALNYGLLFPAPNTPGCATNAAQDPGAACYTNNYVVSPNRTQFSNTVDARVDHRFNDRNLLFARYDYNKVDTNTPQALGTQNGLQISGGRYIFAGPATDKASQYVLGYTHQFSANLLMDLRAAYTRINNLSLPLNYGLNADTKVGFGANMNFNNLSNFLTPLNFGGFSDLGDGAYVPLQDIDGTYQYAGVFSYVRGNHSMKFGVSYIRRQARNVQSAFAAGQYGFGLPTDTSSNTNQQEINQLASSLVGAFASDNRNYDLFPPDYRTYEPSGFAQDSWKASSKLTVLYGIRYDLFTPFTEAHNHISNFSFYQALNSSTTTVGNALQVANVNGVGSTAGIKTDYSNVAPRVGFAYSVNPLLVIRGGYGLSYFPGNYTSNADLKNAPFVSVFSPNCQSSLAVAIEKKANGGVTLAGQNPDCATVAGAPTTFDAGLPLPAPQTINSNGLSFIAEDPHLRSARIQQFNLQVEQQFGANVLTVGYVGNIGEHLVQTINDINVPKPFNPNTQVQGQASLATRPLNALLPNLGSVGFLVSGGYSNYNALQTSFQRRFTKGLAFDANYTWGKAMSTNTGFSQEGAQGAYNADPTRINLIDYGIAENDIQNRMAVSLNYEVQYGKNFTGFKKQLLAGYHFNTITVYESGHPFSILNGGGTGGLTTNPIAPGSYTTPSDQLGGINAGSFGNRATPQNNGGNDRPSLVGNPHLGHATNAEFFNVAAFAPQPLGTIGTVRRNSLFGPHYRKFDLSMFKDFPITEGIQLQFRAEAFNITNTPDFFIAQGSGSVQLGNAAFGSVTAVDPNYNPRQLQFALKLQF